MMVIDDYIYQVLRPNRISVDMDVVGVATYTPGEDYVAKQLNVPRTAVVQMESGSRKIASDELSTLCDIYGLSADYVLDRTNDNPSVRFIARSFESLSEEDQQEIASLIEFKKEMAERRKNSRERHNTCWIMQY